MFVRRVLIELNEHKSIHTGEKPFSCELCEMRFRQKKTLKDHQRTHTGEKRFSCELCDKRFAHKSGLKNHMFTTHFNSIAYNPSAKKA